jgi:dihydroorotase
MVAQTDPSVFEELDIASNLHTHWRNGPMAPWMVNMLIENGFRWVVLGMPNTKPNALLEGDDAIEYFRREIKEDAEYVAATIAVQYLAFTSDDVLGYSEASKGLIQVHNGCKPQYKDPEDREAVQEAALSGDSRFFYGGDDAAHFESAKHEGACGTFSTPVAIPWLISWFKKQDAYPKLNPFLAHYGPDYYGFDRPEGKLIFQKKTWKVQPKYPVPGTIQSVVPLFAGEEMEYQLVN